MMIGLLGLETLSAQECRVIRILGGMSVSPLALEPKIAFINKGDCVVWFNRVYPEKVEIIFNDGKKCLDVTKSSMGFTLNDKGCYATTWLPLAGTSSLRFMEKGTYKYVVKAKGIMPGQNVEEGQIVVE